MRITAKLSDLANGLNFASPDHLTRYDRATDRMVMVEQPVLRSVEESDAGALAGLPQRQEEQIEVVAPRMGFPF